MLFSVVIELKVRSRMGTIFFHQILLRDIEG